MKRYILLLLLPALAAASRSMHQFLLKQRVNNNLLAKKLKHTNAELDRIKKDFEKLKEMDGSTVTPQILDVIKQMQTILETQVLHNILEAHKSDQTMLDSAAASIESCAGDYDAQLTISVALKSKADGEKSKLKTLQDKAEKKAQDYFSIANLFAQAYQMQRAVCCKRDAAYANPITFPVGKGYVDCDFAKQTVDACIEAATSEISAAKYLIMDKGRDWEGRDKTCRDQTNLANQRRNEDTKAYHEYGVAVKSCEDAVLSYNKADEGYFKFLAASCQEYISCAGNNTAFYENTRAHVSTREKSISANFKLGSELQCILSAFIEAGKVDMSLAASCRNVEAPAKLDITYPSIPPPRQCTQHNLDVRAPPQLIDHMTVDDAPCDELPNHRDEMVFLQEPACASWCQPVAANQPTMPTRMPTTMPPTLSPTQSIHEKLAEKALQARIAAEDAAKLAAERAKEMAMKMASAFRRSF